jgi:hypothetical protein
VSVDHGYWQQKELVPLLKKLEKISLGKYYIIDWPEIRGEVR